VTYFVCYTLQITYFVSYYDGEWVNKAQEDKTVKDLRTI